MKTWREFSLLSEDEINFLAETARNIPEGDIVMAGVFNGGDVIELFKVTEGKNNIIVIDSFAGLDMPSREDKESEKPCQQGECATEGGLRGFKKNLKQFDVKAEIYKMWISMKTLQDIKQRPVSMVWLDLDHYSPTLDCMLYFWPMLINKGIMLTHDYHFFRTPGIDKAIADFGGEWIHKIGGIAGRIK